METRRDESDNSDRDQQLAARIRVGDLDAFEQVFRAYYEPLRRFALGYTRSPDTAEDVVQDVMIGTWERRAEFASRTTVAGYLFRAARNRALSMLAHDAVVRKHADETALLDPAAAPATDELVFATELERAAHDKIEALPRRVREVYRLRRDNGLSNPEIADVLGITVQTVYVQLGRAMKALHGALAPWIDDEDTSR